MVDFELRKEIKKDVFRLATSMGQDEKMFLYFFTELKNLPFLLYGF